MLKTISSLHGVKVLNKEQQSKIGGGRGSCAAYIPSGTYDTGATPFGDGHGSVVLNCPCYLYDTSKSRAKEMVSNGGNWCCDSCGSASWYHPN